MASITGSASIDWADVLLPELDVAGDIARVHVLLEEVSEAIDIGSNELVSASRSRFVFDVFDPIEGRVTYRGSRFGTDDAVITSVQFASSETAERFSLVGVIDDRGSSDKVTTLTYRSPDGSYTVSASGNITERTNAHDGTVTSVVISASGYKIRLTGKLTLDGNEITDVTTLTGNVTALSVSGAGGTIDITGIAIPFDVVQSIEAMGDVFTIVAPYLTGNDNIAYAYSLGMSLDGGPGNDTIAGGSALDTLVGGSGDDHFTLRSLDDSVVVENPGEGGDTVRLAWNVSAPTTVDVAQFENVENLLAAGTGAFHLTGDDAGNALTGNASGNALTGGEGDDTLDGKGSVDTMTGGPGDDFFVVDRASDVVLENADEGSDTVRITYATKPVQTLDLGLLHGGHLEGLHAAGAGPWRLVGNERDNVLTGNASANRLTGGAGNDTMTGGAGNDLYFVDSPHDVVVEAAKGGTDSVRSSSGFALGPNVESLLLTDAGGHALIGNASRNAITGNLGDDTLEGAGGNDTLRGGAGNDLYVAGVGKDSIVESAGGGEDTVQSVASFSIAALAHVEHITLAGSAHANATGNAGANLLIGNDGNNRLDGRGGADTMSGGVGDDLYILDRDSDVVDEAADGGGDTVRLAYTAATPALIDLNVMFNNVEHVDITGSGVFHLAGDGADNALAGNASRNGIAGGDGNDTLDGRGGVDTMTGGAGDDLYVLDRASDVVLEVPGGGYDSARLSYGVNSTTIIDLALLFDGNIESVHAAGAGAFRLYGNDEDNALTGNSSANVLDGRAGEDTMTGGAGNDTYYVDSPDDLVVEAAKGGTDTVRSAAAAYVLTANVERLILTGTGQSGTGNALRNTITGTAGDDTLDGGGGNDTLRGGAGNDTYLVGDGTDTVVEGAEGGEDAIYSSASFSIASAAHVEQLTLTGSANTNATGNGLRNILTGNGGNNRLDGRSGIDTMRGGLGDDTYVLDSLDDVAEEDADGGSDTVQLAFDVGGLAVDLSLFPNIERIEILGDGRFDIAGTDGDDVLTGNASANLLSGGAGNDTLDGKGGRDTLAGGPGDDVFIVDRGSDVISETAGEGSDTARISYNVASTTTIDLSLLFGGQVENAEIAGTGAFRIIGTAGHNLLVGNASANRLSGGAGNDTLDGRAGRDTMIGGAGDDVFVLDRVSDIVMESPGGGSDTVRLLYDSAPMTINLAADYGGVIENVELLGTGAINLTGNSSHNRLIGNTSRNVLVGGEGNDTLDGGGGNDQMTGGLGDDVYVVRDPSAFFLEFSNQGIDTVLYDFVPSETYRARLDAGMENVEILSSGRFDISGNFENNALTGNSDDNVIDGGGGSDTMRGAGGNDQYFVGNYGDVVIEEPGGGSRDSVFAHIDDLFGTYTLPEHVEDLSLGHRLANGTGNALDNTIVGGTNNNILSGLGGNDVLQAKLGTDTLLGGQGDDTLIGESGDELRGGQGNDVYHTSVRMDPWFTLDVTGEVGHPILDGESLHLDAGAAFFPPRITVSLFVMTSADVNDPDRAELLIAQGSTTLWDMRFGSYTAGLNFGVGTFPSQTLGARPPTDEISHFFLGGAGLSSAAGSFTINTWEVVPAPGGWELVSLDMDFEYYVEGNPAALTGKVVYGDPVPSFLDAVFEEDGQGVDTVVASADAATSGIVDLAGSNVENVTLTGAGNVGVIGTGADNVLVGNDGDNSLEGKAGNDTLTGGDGEDRFVFSVLDLDTIADFTSGEDRIVLDSAVFGALVPGGGVDGFVFYDEETGGLYYDADGAGEGTPVQFATLSGAPALAGADVEVI